MKSTDNKSSYFEEHWKKERATRTGGQSNNEVDKLKKRHTVRPFIIQKQTVTPIKGAVLVTHTAINVDNDGVDKSRSGIGKAANHDHQLPGNYDNMEIDPTIVPYLVYGDTRHIDDHGIKPGDFGVVIHGSRMAGGPAIDDGHSVLGEASVKLERLLGVDPGKNFTNRIEPGGAISIGFPGSGKDFDGPYTSDAIEAYSAKTYDQWAQSNPVLVKKYDLPAKFIL